MWLEPSTESPKRFPDAEVPQCPICSEPLYGPSSRWAQPQDLTDTVWQDAAIFDVPSTEAAVEDFLTPEDFGGEMDVPFIPEGGFSSHTTVPEPPVTVVERFPDLAENSEEKIEKQDH